MDNTSKGYISLIFIFLSFLILGYTFYNNKYGSQPIDNYTVTSNVNLNGEISMDLTKKLTSGLSKDISLVIVLDNLSCPLCLNEVVSLLDFTKQEFNDYLEPTIWYTLTDTNRVKNYVDSIDREVLFTIHPLQENFEMNIGSGNHLLFIDRKGKKLIAHTVLSTNITPIREKREVFEYVIDNYNK